MRRRRRWPLLLAPLLLLAHPRVRAGAIAVSLRLSDPLRAPGEAPLPPLLPPGAAATREAWEERRAALLQTFTEEVFGALPEVPLTRRLELREQALEGGLTRWEGELVIAAPRGELRIELSGLLPATRPAPAILLIDHRLDSLRWSPDSETEFWPARRIAARGFAALALRVADVAPDAGGPHFPGGLWAALSEAPRGPRDAGCLAAWAWGARQALLALRSEPALDPERIAIAGHSRGGKAALWAGAQEPGFALVIANASGCSGAALSRRRKGETLWALNSYFPHWFCERYHSYNRREEALPIDQHQLLALTAPRRLYIASAAGDSWADPAGEHLSAIAASPAWELYGATGLPRAAPLPEGEACHEGRIGAHTRSGGHDLNGEDWRRILDFAALTRSP